MSTIFAALQHTYNGIQLALFNGNTCIAQIESNKRDASKMLIPYFKDLLTSKNLSLTDLSFIAVNHGPGPFTTLRVVIASANGIAFGSSIPLVHVDGLAAFKQEYDDTSYPHTVYLLNAFNNDVYACYENEHRETITTCKNITDLLTTLSHAYSDTTTIRFLGSAVSLHKDAIIACFGTRAFIPHPLPETCSITQIGITGYELWGKNEHVVTHITPHYLKMQQFQKTPGL